jgi:hypothetical protein
MPKKPIQPRQHKRRGYIRAVFGLKDLRFPKRHPEIEARYPGHLLPSSPSGWSQAAPAQGHGASLANRTPASDPQADVVTGMSVPDTELTFHNVRYLVAG